MRVPLWSSVAIGVTLSTGCVSDPYTFRQRGVVAAPRASLYDGQPMTTTAQVSGYAATTAEPSIQPDTDSGAVVTRHQAGGAIRGRVSAAASVGLAVDASWRTNARTLSGARTAEAGIPNQPVYGAMLELRRSTPIGPGLHLGIHAALGGQSHPVVRDGVRNVQRDLSLVLHGGVVPSWQQGDLTLFASLSAGTESDVPAEVRVVPDGGDSNDPGVEAEAVGGFASLGLGASYRLADRARLTVQGSQASGSLATYGARVDVGLTVDLGASRPAR